VISTVAFCPQPPALVPALASGAAAELAPLRAACAEAISRLSAGGRRLVALGAGTSSRSHSPRARGTLAGYGLPVELTLGAPAGGGAFELPLSLTVGAWLIAETLGPASGAIGFTIDDNPSCESVVPADLLHLAATEDVALLVMGDGSACRSERAPGPHDPRAGAFDEAVAAALAQADARALATLDPTLGATVLAAGVPAWRVAGRLLADVSYEARLLYADDPYGVGYYVAAWTARG
jgi:hypothetical protein